MGFEPRGVAAAVAARSMSVTFDAPSRRAVEARIARVAKDSKAVSTMRRRKPELKGHQAEQRFELLRLKS